MLIAYLILVPGIQGRASQYAPGVMQKVIANRQDWGQIPQDLSKYDGFIAVQECDNIGKEYLLIHEGKSYLVLGTDCACKTDHQYDMHDTTDDSSGYKQMGDNNIVAGINWELAVELNAEGRIINIVI